MRLINTLLILIAIGLALRFYALDQLDVKGLQLYDLQQKRDRIKRDNMRLQEEIYHKTSLTEVYRIATPSGFVTPKYIYIR